MLRTALLHTLAGIFETHLFVCVCTTFLMVRWERNYSLVGAGSGTFESCVSRGDVCLSTCRHGMQPTHSMCVL